MKEKPQFLNQKLIIRNLLTDNVGSQERIYCEGFNYLTIYTDGYFNPYIPFIWNNVTLANGLFIDLYPSRQIISLAHEFNNIPVKDEEYFDWFNYDNPTDNGTVENGFNHIYFHLTKYLYNEMVDKPNGFQFEFSEDIATGLLSIYHFGIDRINNSHVLAIPFIPDCFNKLVYLYKEEVASPCQVKQFTFYMADGTNHNETMAVDTLTELLLPCKRFIIHFQANAISNTEVDFMLKFEKA